MSNVKLHPLYGHFKERYVIRYDKATRSYRVKNNDSGEIVGRGNKEYPTAAAADLYADELVWYNIRTSARKL
jgi:hypothetical protein